MLFYRDVGTGTCLTLMGIGCVSGLMTDVDGYFVITDD